MDLRPRRLVKPGLPPPVEFQDEAEEHDAVDPRCPWTHDFLPDGSRCDGRVFLRDTKDTHGATVVRSCGSCGRAVTVVIEERKRMVDITIGPIDPDGPAVLSVGAECPDRWHTRDAKLPPGHGDPRCPCCHDDGDRTAGLFPAVYAALYPLLAARARAG